MAPKRRGVVGNKCSMFFPRPSRGLVPPLCPHPAHLEACSVAGVLALVRGAGLQVGTEQGVVQQREVLPQLEVSYI